MTDAGADYRTRDCCGIVTAAAADLVTDDAADDAAEQRASGDRRKRTGFDIADVVVALARGVSMRTWRTIGSTRVTGA